MIIARNNVLQKKNFHQRENQKFRMNPTFQVWSILDTTMTILCLQLLFKKLTAVGILQGDHKNYVSFWHLKMVFTAEL